jgi:hypothetical protein
MIRSQFASALALAAFLAVPAFAQSTTEVAPLDKAASKQHAAAPHMQAKADSTTTSSTSTPADVSAGTRSVDGAYVAPLEKNSSKQSAAANPKKQAKADQAKPCTGAQADVSSGTTTANGAYVAPLEKASAQQQAQADGKVAANTTGHASVSTDCVADSQMKPTKTAKKKSTKTASTK